MAGYCQAGFRKGIHKCGGCDRELPSSAANADLVPNPKLLAGIPNILLQRVRPTMCGGTLVSDSNLVHFSSQIMEQIYYILHIKAG